MTDTGFEKIAVLDLARHLDKRIETVLQDFMDRCCEGGVRYEVATAKAVMILSHYFVRAASGLDAHPNEIMAVCLQHYEESIEHERATAGGAGPAKRRRVS